MMSKAYQRVKPIFLCRMLHQMGLQYFVSALIRKKHHEMGEVRLSTMMAGLTILIGLTCCGLTSMIVAVLGEVAIVLWSTYLL